KPHVQILLPLQGGGAPSPTCRSPQTGGGRSPHPPTSRETPTRASPDNRPLKSTSPLQGEETDRPPAACRKGSALLFGVGSIAQRAGQEHSHDQDPGSLHLRRGAYADRPFWRGAVENPRR